MSDQNDPITQNLTPEPAAAPVEATEPVVASTSEGPTPAAPVVAEPTGAELGWPQVKSGMQVRVHQLIKEVNAKGEEKERTQIFEGLVLKRRGGTSAGATFTVRKQSFGVWVEKIFPLHLPGIINIEITKTFKTHRAKLGYLRNPRAKRLKEVKKVVKK